MVEFDWVGQYHSLILSGILMTATLTAISGLMGVLLGVVANRVLVSGVPAVCNPISFFVNFVRNTPLLIQLFFVFFGLPSIGVRISPMEAAVLTMVINVGAYSTEIVRAGIDATPKGQVEAGMALGMSRGEIFRHVQIIPALTRIWPALSSQLVLVMLGSSVVSVISVEDLSFAANFIQSRNFKAFETYSFMTAVYLVLSFVFRAALNRLGVWLFPRGSRL